MVGGNDLTSQQAQRLRMQREGLLRWRLVSTVHSVHSVHSTLIQGQQKVYLSNLTVTAAPHLRKLELVLADPWSELAFLSRPAYPKSLHRVPQTAHQTAASAPPPSLASLLAGASAAPVA